MTGGKHVSLDCYRKGCVSLISNGGLVLNESAFGMASPASLKVVTEPPAAPLPQECYRLNEQIGFQLRVAMQRHTAIFMSRMVEGLTQTQFAALAKLLEVGACSQNQLGRLIYLDAATIKGVVDRLHRRGFLTSTSDRHDRRRRAVVLTEAGRAATQAAIGIAAEITVATLTHLLTKLG
jgi:DNA-binding MarR family transcriptional regulator